MDLYTVLCLFSDAGMNAHMMACTVLRRGRAGRAAAGTVAAGRAAAGAAAAADACIHDDILCTSCSLTS